ncbi:unnamed protein product [Phytomonas sp. EM1]|nr:unnamed protein product [Phytomonas sp. EM1]|eukprot:CCW60432.1 unnamed protein product [Phytomonas sp. isolate EM1]
MYTRKAVSAAVPTACKTLKSIPAASAIHAKGAGKVAKAYQSKTTNIPVIEPTFNGISLSPKKPNEGVLGENETLNKIVNVVRAATAPFADLDEIIARPPGAEQRGVVASREERLSVAGTPRITHRSFAASLICPKKFYLFQQRPDLVPDASIGESVFLDDAAGFNELARQWDRLQFGSKAILISDSGLVEAAQHTENVIVNYFETTYASLREQAPSLTIHRPAFLAPFGGYTKDHSGAGASPSHPLLLCARPLVLRYRPKDNQWVILEAQAIVDPLATAARAGQILQRIHFSALAFLHSVTQPHIPISLRKRFLNIDLDTVTEENMKGHVLEHTARAVAPIDLKRSGVLHIRQFFPGPVTLLDCDPPRLVKFVQRLSLDELLHADGRQQLKQPHPGSCAGAFDLQHLARFGPDVQAAHRAMVEALQRSDRYGNARNNRSVRQKETNENALFQAQQQLMRALLLHHTLPLTEKFHDPTRVRRWLTFSSEAPNGLVHSTYARLEEQAQGQEKEKEKEKVAAVDAKSGKGGKRGAGKKNQGKAADLKDPTADAVCAAPSLSIPSIPHFSENIGAHCSRADACPFFVEGMCLPQKVANPIKACDNHLFTLPSTSLARKVTWWGEGLRTIRDVLYQYKCGYIKLTAPQLRYVKAVAEGHVAINPKEIDKFFAKIRYPTFIIDFEASQFALPPYQKVNAYNSVPFQFSMDVFQEDILTETPTHYDFLHFGKGYSPNEDPRPKLIAELMRVVKLEREKKRQAMEASGELGEGEEETVVKGSGKRGAKKAPKINKNNPLEGPLTPYDGCFISHFSSFEKSCLEKLGQLEERFKEEIKSFYFLDTMDLIKKGFSHPNAHGSNSLKKVLPALCPDFQYGVFGSETEDADGVEGALLGRSEEGPRQDEQKGENAMGIYRLWYHQEGGGTVQDLRHNRVAAQPFNNLNSINGEASHSGDDAAARTCVPKEVRERVWSRLRIQLLEYCSLDTKALYEIMREIWKEKEAAKNLPSVDKSGWVYVAPTPREVSF